MNELDAEVAAAHDAQCERVYTESGFIFIDCLCSLRRAKAEAWDEGYTIGNRHNGRRDANPYRAAHLSDTERAGDAE